MKRFIFLCSNFPPLTSGATPVILNLSRYLPSAGWEMRPITVRDPMGLPIDNSLWERLPGDLRVRKVFHPDPSALVRRLRRRGTGAEPQVRRSNPSGLMNTLLLPDRLVTWMPFVVPAGVRAIRNDGAKVVISFGPHHSLHLHGWLMARLAGVPHLPFFCDLWLYDSYVKWPSALHRAVASLLEGFVVGHADGLVATTEGSVGYFRKRYGDRCPPAHVAENGYDPQTSLPAAPGGRGGRMAVTFTGNFFGAHSPENVLRGLRLLLDREPDAPVVVRFIGSFPEACGRLAAELKLGDALEVSGSVPFLMVPQAQMDADVLLTILPDLPGSELKNSSKLAEYLRTGKPVIAVAPEGDMTAHIRRLGAGWVASPSPAGFASALAEALEAWRNGVLSGARDMNAVAETFDARNIAARLGRFLDGFAEHRRVPERGKRPR